MLVLLIHDSKFKNEKQHLLVTLVNLQGIETSLERKVESMMSHSKNHMETWLGQNHNLNNKQ